MMKYSIALAVLLMLAGTGLATMWLYDDPMFFQTNYPAKVESFKAADMSILEIIDSPYFPLLGQSFYTSAIPVKLSNNTNTIQIGSKASSAMSPVQVTFGGHLEDNLKYAQSKSSLRIGSQGSWGTLNTPGVL
ncbi:MAG: hypothetical protein A4E49_00829 [Methanosaeta sp. PtaU1.Bin112]|nr:MAG: hypothetical protein A4E49_00829 [Methanosaeta sp. PtaU1.Bin112]